MRALLLLTLLRVAGFSQGFTGTWTNLGANTSIKTHNPCKPNNFNGSGFPFKDNCAGIILDWGGGVWDDQHKLLYLQGEGHSGGIDNAVLAIDPIGTNSNCSGTPCIFELVPTDPNVSLMTPQGQCTVTTCQPVATHDYGGLLYFQRSHMLWRAGGIDYGGDSQGQYIWELDTNNPGAGWTAITANTPTGFASPPGYSSGDGFQCVVDPTTTDETAICQFYIGFAFVRWDRQTGLWTTICGAACAT